MITCEGGHLIGLFPCQGSSDISEYLVVSQRLMDRVVVLLELLNVGLEGLEGRGRPPQRLENAVLPHPPRRLGQRPGRPSFPPSGFAQQVGEPVQLRMSAVGGLPRLGRALRGPRAVRRAAPTTSRAAFLDLLKAKGVWLSDVQRHPMVVGVPVGRDGGSGQGIAVDVGLKNMATVSLHELSEASPQIKAALVDRALGSEPIVGDPELLRNPPAVPMAVLVTEDLQNLPVASPVRKCPLQTDLRPPPSPPPSPLPPPSPPSAAPAPPNPHLGTVGCAQVHPAALKSGLPDELLKELADPLFTGHVSDMHDFVVPAVPGADAHLASKRELRKQQRFANRPPPYTPPATDGRGSS